MAMEDSGTPPDKNWWKKYSNQKENNPFKKDGDARMFAESLLRAAPADRGAEELGLQVMELDEVFPGVSASKNLFFRKHTREVLGVLLYRMRLHDPPILMLNDQPIIDQLINPDDWTGEEAELLDKDSFFSHAVIEGAPGIGKSFSLLWLLRVLLQRGEHVVFHSMRTNSVYQFVPPRENDGLSAEKRFDEEGRPRYRVFKCTDNGFDPGSCAALANPQAFYLFDPIDKKGQAATVAAHTVTAASPNSVHYNQRNNESDDWYFMSPWTLPEVLAVASVAGNELMIPSLRLKFNDEKEVDKALEEEVRRAFYICGGSLRNIFSRKLEAVVTGQDTSIKGYVPKIKFDNDVRAMFNLNGEIDGDEVPKKSSRLFAYRSKFPFTLNKRWRTFASSRVSCKLALKYKNFLIHTVNHLLSEKEFDTAGIAFETGGLELLSTGGEFGTRNAPVRSLHDNDGSNHFTTVILSSVGAQDRHRMRGHGKNLTALCASLPSVEEQRERNLPRSVCASDDRTFAFLDCVDAKNRGYQFTISKVHKIAPDAAFNFLTAVGATEEKPFHLYLVVPSFIGHDDKLTQSIAGIKKFSKKHPDKLEFLKKCLVHHVLVIDAPVCNKRKRLRAQITSKGTKRQKLKA